VLPVVLPAAGRGTRLRSIDPETPKLLLPVGPRPMIDWCLAELLRCGAGEVTVVVDDAGGALARHVLAHRDGSEVRIVEQPEPTGIGDAILRARAGARGAFVLALPDVIDRGEPLALARLLAVHAATGDGALLGLVRLDAAAAARWGNCGRAEAGPPDAHGRRTILRLADKGAGALRVEGTALVTAPRCVLDEAFLDALRATAPPPGAGEGEHDDVPAFQRLIARGALRGVEVAGPLLDAGNPAGYEAACRALAG